MSSVLVLCHHIRANCSSPPLQCLGHCKFVGQRIVGHEVQVAISVHVNGKVKDTVIYASNHTKWVVNLSSGNLTSAKENVLSKF